MRCPDLSKHVLKGVQFYGPGISGVRHMRRGKEERFGDIAPRGLIDELRRRGYAVDDKSPTEIVRLIMQGELRKTVPARGWTSRVNGSHSPGELPYGNRQ